jgi:hypothetical protein
MITSLRRGLASAFACLLLAAPLAAQAQAVAVPGPNVPLQAQAYGAVGAAATAVDANHGLPVSCLAGCASAVPFVQTGHTTLAVTTTSGRVALPSADQGLWVQNTGSVDLTYRLGNGSVTALTTDAVLKAGAWAFFSANAQLDIAAITASGTTSLDVQTGTGAPTFAGGGGAGGGGAVTATSGAYADGSIATIGAQADPACTTDAGTCTEQALVKRLIQRLTSINTTLGTPFQAGGSVGNSGFGVNFNAPNITATGALAVLNDEVDISPAGLQGLGVEITGTNAGGVITPECKIAGVWTAITVIPLSGGPKVQSISAAGSYESIGGGVALCRARLSTAGSGSFTANLLASNGTRLIRAFNTDPNNFFATVTATASETHLGEVGGNENVAVQVTPASTAVAYTAATAVGGLQTVPGAVRVSGGTGLLQDVQILWKSTRTTSDANVDLFLFSDTSLSSTCTNATAFVLSATDWPKFLGVIHITDVTAGNTTTVTQALNLAKTIKAAATSIYACMVVRGAPTLVVNDPTINFNFIR